MRRLAVIGDPVGHSLSPLIHMTWIDALGLDASYESIRVPAGETAAALDDFEYQEFLGLNVTLPHKQAVLPKASEKSAAVDAIGAANTLSRLPPGGWRADNTDAPGLIAALGRLGLSEFTGKTVLMLGAGGAARSGRPSGYCSYRAPRLDWIYRNSAACSDCRPPPQAPSWRYPDQ